MLVFLDFEASSLRKAGYPIEVGWVREDGEGEAHLIRPPPIWADWDEDAERIHGISRETLIASGDPPDAVVERMTEGLTGHELFASAPSWDGKWLSMLLRAAGRPRHLLRLRDSDEAFRAAALARGETEDAAKSLVDAVRLHAQALAPAHRALADARREWEIWSAIVRGDGFSERDRR